MSGPDFDKLPKITSLEALEEYYGSANPLALAKEIDYISDDYRAFIEHAPFVLVATTGPEGLDCSPRGDPPGFVRVANERTVLIPDRRGNNRLDTLRNIITGKKISLLFLIPGVGETLRINGEAELTNDADLCASFAINGKPARSVIIVSVGSVYYQCPKALVRSKLWARESQANDRPVPTSGEILQALMQSDFDGKEWDRAYPERMKKTIY